MTDRKFRFHDGKIGSAITVRVTPRARKNEIVEILSDQTVKVRLTAPPVEGKANKALIKFLADVLEIPKSKFEIVAGDTGRDKIVSILGSDSDQVQKKLMDYLA